MKNAPLTPELVAAQTREALATGDKAVVGKLQVDFSYAAMELMEAGKDDSPLAQAISDNDIALQRWLDQNAGDMAA